jgi:hypothetical protein
MGVVFEELNSYSQALIGKLLTARPPFPKAPDPGSSNV